MDVPLLIGEIYKRPALWNIKHGEHKDRRCIPKLWQEVAEIVGTDVDQCKRKWKNLRDAYRAEIKRSERRIERDKLMGEYDPKTNYNSKWVYFPIMGFIDDNVNNTSRSTCYTVENENTNSNSNGNNNHNNDEDDDDNEPYNNSIYEENFHSAYDIKLEPSHNDMEENLHNFAENTNNADEDEAANDMLFEEFQNIATPQAARRLSATLSINQAFQQNAHHHQHQQQQQQQQPQNVQPNSSRASNCKCSKRTDDQVHFLEDLGREEQKLIKSTKQDITRSNKLEHVGDSDYNFLVSFLPQMKKMSELQNLQFRAKMCDMVLNIFAPSTAVAETRSSSSSNDVSVKPQPMEESSITPAIMDHSVNTMDTTTGSNNLS